MRMMIMLSLTYSKSISIFHWLGTEKEADNYAPLYLLLKVRSCFPLLLRLKLKMNWGEITLTNQLNARKRFTLHTLLPFSSGVSSWYELVECYTCECIHRLLGTLYTMLLFASWMPSFRELSWSPLCGWCEQISTTFGSMFRVMCLENVNSLPKHVLCDMFGEWHFVVNCPSIAWNTVSLSRCYHCFHLGSVRGGVKLFCKFYQNWPMKETITRILKKGNVSISICI